jgi:hypothetical protein
LGIGQSHGILHSVATAIGAATTEAPQWPKGRRGRIPQGLFAPGTVTVPLRSRRAASPFWIILLLVFRPNGSWSDPHAQPHDATVTALALAT